MGLRVTGTRGASAAISFLAAAALAVSASPASASASQGYVAGSGIVTDDWGDEGPLSSTQYRHSDVTKMWQFVLWAEQAREQDGTVFDSSDIDCDFGPNTTYATKDLQRRWGLTADGIVGPKTFGRADNNLFLSADNSYGTQWVGYTGKDRVVTFLRGKSPQSSGAYYVEQDSDSFWMVYYNKATTC